MILNNQWIQIAIVASSIVLCAVSIEIRYDNDTRKVTIRCGDSDYTGHSELIDKSDCNGCENATNVHFSGACETLYVPQTFLKRLALVETVNLGSNDVKSIKRQDFSQNKKLKFMLLGHNRITELPENLFSFTPQVEEAYFEYNKINRIDPNTFAEGVDNLKIIYLHMNLITTLHENLFSKVKMLKKLWLQDNKIVRFDCNILPPSVANMTMFYVGDYFSSAENGKTKVWLRGNPLEHTNFDCSQSSLPFTNDETTKDFLLSNNYSSTVQQLYNSTTNNETTEDFPMANNNSSTNGQSMESNEIIQHHYHDNEVLHTIKYLLIFLCVVCLAFIVTEVVIHLKARKSHRYNGV